MFRRQVSVLKCVRQLTSRRSLTDQVGDVKPKWDLLCGVCLERKPSISRPPREIEIKFAQMLREIEDENSLKSDYELLVESEERQIAGTKKGIHGDATQEISNSSPIEMALESKKELAEFSLAPRETEADEKNDTKSVNRKLDEHLLYVTKEHIGDDSLWILPQGPLQGNESLRQAAERILREKYGRKVKAKFYGNAPCGFYKYKYPKKMRENVGGAKIFFMKAQYIAGEVENETSRLDFAWNSMEELLDKMHQPYYKAVKSFMFDDEK